MILIKKILLTLIFFLTISIVSYAYPNDPSSQYLMVNLTSENFIFLNLNDDFKIDNIGKEIKLYLREYPTYIPLDDIKSLGFIYIDGNFSSIESLESQALKNWKIYNKEGKLIKSNEGSKPDLNDLHPGELYIIKSGTETFKYFPLR